MESVDVECSSRHRKVHTRRRRPSRASCPNGATTPSIPVGHAINMPVDSARILRDVAEMINKLWATTRQADASFPARQPRVAAVAPDGGGCEMLTNCRARDAITQVAAQYGLDLAQIMEPPDLLMPCPSDYRQHPTEQLHSLAGAVIDTVQAAGGPTAAVQGKPVDGVQSPDGGSNGGHAKERRQARVCRQESRAARLGPGAADIVADEAQWRGAGLEQELDRLTSRWSAQAPQAADRDPAYVSR